VTDFGVLSLAELVELRDRVARELTDRFEQRLALLFTDVVGSTAYLARYGDVAGRELLARHHRLLGRVVDELGGRIVDTAGDGAFCTFSGARDGAVALVRLFNNLLEDNAGVGPVHRLKLRSALHWGPVLVDGDHVTGHAVHTAARLCDAAEAGECRLSDAAFAALPANLKPLCRRAGEIDARGLETPIETSILDWRDPKKMPTAIEIVETGFQTVIPLADTVAIGRMAEVAGRPANDIVIELPNSDHARRISRWHLELEITPDGYLLRSVGRAVTEINGETLTSEITRLVRPGDEIRLGKVATLRLFAPTLDTGTTTIATLLETKSGDLDTRKIDRQT
jgi:class 3 adenylate cyclase